MTKPRNMIRGWQLAACWGLVLGFAVTAGTQAADPAPPTSPAGGIRELPGRHLTLVTDLPASPEVDALPAIFDLAFPQWCQYFHVDPQQHALWHVTGYLVHARERFEQAGLMPANLPRFRTGYSLGEKLWLYDQESAYYRRHLLLHEGTHSFMNMLLGGSGPPWYTEGMAELLATHRWNGEQLTLNYFPRDTAEVPRLGRVQIVQTGFEAGHAKSLPAVMAYDSQAHLQNEPYGWCWAACAFLDGHPRYRERFRTLYEQVTRQDFNPYVQQLYGEDWPRACEEWQIFVANLDYGYDFARMAVDFAPGKPLSEADPGGRPAKFTAQVAADRGWQPSGVRLEAGRTYRLTATGRYQVADKPRVWWCEPGGVTIDYYHGQPLGVLLAAVRPDEVGAKRGTPLIKPRVIGLDATLKPTESGTLYLRINDSAGKLADNAGTLTVVVEAESDAKK